MSCSFQYRNLYSPWLNLFLSILLIDTIVNVIILFLFSDNSCYCLEMLLIYVCLFYSATLMNLLVLSILLTYVTVNVIILFLFQIIHCYCVEMLLIFGCLFYVFCSFTELVG